MVMWRDIETELRKGDPNLEVKADVPTPGMLTICKAGMKPNPFGFLALFGQKINLKGLQAACGGWYIGFECLRNAPCDSVATTLPITWITIGSPDPNTKTSIVQAVTAAITKVTVQRAADAVKAKDALALAAGIVTGSAALPTKPAAQPLVGGQKT